MAHHSELNTMVASAKDLSIISTIQAKPLYENEEFLRQKYLQEGLSTRQIATEIHSARSTVKEALRRFMIPMRPEEEARFLNKEQLAYGERTLNGRIVSHKFEQKNLLKIIALRESGASYGDIADWLNSRGIPTKNCKKKWERTTIYKLVKSRSQSGSVNQDLRRVVPLIDRLRST